MSNETELFSSHDREFVSIIGDLENLDNNSEANAEVTKTGRTEKEFNFSELYLNLLETERTNSSKMETTPPTLSTNSSECQNSSCSLVESNETEIFSIQDRELASILEDLEKIDNNRVANATEKNRLSGYFCSDTIFNLTRNVLTDSEIKVLEKGLEYAPIQSKINEPELQNDFEEFCRRMHLKWYFRKEPTSEFSETSSLTPKSSWKPPKGHPSLEVFLSEIEKEIFAIPDS